MPGYEPFLLCDFHVHTHVERRPAVGARGRRSLRPDRQVRRHRDHRSHPDEAAICWRAPARLATLGRRALLGDRGADFDAYLARHRRARPSARAELYGMLVDPRRRDHAEPLRSKKNSHIIALDITRVHQRRSAGRRHPARDPAAGRAEHRLPSAPPDDAAHRDQHLLSLGPPQAAGRSGGRVGSGQPRRSVLGDQPQALSRTSPTATSTSRSTSTRGRRCCAARRTGRRSRARCATTSTSR